MSVVLDQEAARQRLVNFAIDADLYHVVTSKQDFQSFNEWSKFVLNDTAYGAALIQSYLIPAEITLHLENLWDEPH